MYIVLIFIIFCSYFLPRLNKIRLSYTFLISWSFYGFLVLLITLLAQQGILEKFSQEYLTTYPSDSLRYDHEVGLIKNNLFTVDEINGIIGDYVVTPKLGMSSLIAFLSFPLRDLSIDSHYLIMNLALLLICLFVFKLFFDLMRLHKASLIGSFLLFLFVFIFPVDLYWSAKFLREAIANVLMIGFILAYVSSFFLGPKYLIWSVIFAILLVLFRPQLILLSLVSSGLIIWSASSFKGMILFLRFKNFVFGFLFLVLGIVQTIKSSGRGFFIKIADDLKLEALGSIMSFVEVGFSAWIILILILFSTIKVPWHGAVYCETRINIRFLLSFLFLVYLIYSFDYQIRFLYPNLIACKVLVFYWLISSRFISKKGHFSYRLSKVPANKLPKSTIIVPAPTA